MAIFFTLHTLARTGEVRFAPWDEFDLEARLWSIPASRMKMRVAHTVPLSDQVLVLLERLRPYTGHYHHLFVTRHSGKPISENGMLYALYRLGYRGQLTMHGLRGTGSTLLHEAGFRSEVIWPSNPGHVKKREL
ncbi:MAG TPA: site-specific integrase [Thiolinea sp.]|nr:site-specific integrase [Thiolinea sp.]